jgi:hypothetical protein
MGASGALLFSHLASKVLAFVPRVDLHHTPELNREDVTPARKDDFNGCLARNVRRSTGCEIHLHVSNLSLDVYHLTVLQRIRSSVVAHHHRGCSDHLLGAYLKRKTVELKEVVGDESNGHTRSSNVLVETIAAWLRG